MTRAEGEEGGCGHSAALALEKQTGADRGADRADAALEEPLQWALLRFDAKVRCQLDALNQRLSRQGPCD